MWHESNFNVLLSLSNILETFNIQTLRVSNLTEEMKRQAKHRALSATVGWRVFMFKVRNKMDTDGRDMTSVAESKKYFKQSYVVRMVEFIQ